MLQITLKFIKIEIVMASITLKSDERTNKNLRPTHFSHREKNYFLLFRTASETNYFC